MTSGKYDEGERLFNPSVCGGREGSAQAGSTAAAVKPTTVFDEFAGRIADYRNQACDISGDLRRKIDRIVGSEPPSDTPVMNKDGNQPSAGIDRVFMTLDQLGQELDLLNQQVVRMSRFVGE